jgi:hypothetical protein
MNIPSPLRMMIFGLTFSSVALAQSPSPAPPSRPADGPPSVPAAPAAVTSQLPVVTQSSRVRAFNAGPGGEVRSLYLRNGSVVGVPPALGGELGAAVRKGERITVTGTKSEINGQSVLEAASIRLNDQTFFANPPSSAPPGPGALAQGTIPPPPGPSPRRRNKAAAAAPCAVPGDAPPPPPDFGDPPPPPPDGMAPPPPPPDGMPPPPPPPQE